MNREGIPEDLCKLLDAERDLPGASPDVVEAALARFNAAFGGEGGLSDAAPAAGAAPTPRQGAEANQAPAAKLAPVALAVEPVVRKSLAARALGPLLGLAIGAGLGYVAGSRQAAAPVEPLVSAPSAVSVTPVGPPSAAPPPPSPADVMLEPEPAPSGSVGQAPPRGPSAQRSASSQPPSALPPSSQPPSSLREERILLERARSALLRGDTAAALSACALHQQKFPHGQLSQERDALRKQASAPGPQD